MEGSGDGDGDKVNFPRFRFRGMTECIWPGGSCDQREWLDWIHDRCGRVFRGPSSSRRRKRAVLLVHKLVIPGIGTKSSQLCHR